MGMYTEICTRIELNKKTTPDSVITVLKHMLGETEEFPTIPEHDLFRTSRWEFMLRCSSYYHVPFSTFQLRYEGIANDYYLVGRSDLKDYDNEVALFFDWISPYAESGMLGYSLYEDDAFPVLYIKDIEGSLRLEKMPHSS